MIGEFIVRFNLMDFTFKHFLSSFIEDEMIGYLLTTSQSFEITQKRIDSIYKQLINDTELTERWGALQTEIKALQNIRNDFAHGLIDFDNITKEQFHVTRYSENKVLKFDSRKELYTLTEVKDAISRMKKLNTKIGYIFHTTFMKHQDIAYYDGERMF